MAAGDMFEPYFLLLGAFVHSWSQVERGIDYDVAAIYWRGGAALGLEYPRTAFGRKVKFLRSATRKLDSLRDIADRMTALLTAATELAEARNLFAHGSPKTLNEDGVVIVRLRVDETDLIFRKTTEFVAWAVLQSFVEDAARLARESMAISDLLYDKFVGDAAQ